MAYTIPPFTINEYPDYFLKGMAKRENYSYKRSLFMTISGSSHRKTGTGKSWTALRFGEYNDKDYREGDARKIVYNISDFMSVIGELEDDYRAAPQRTIGQTVVMDEAGSLIGSTQWQQATNRAVKYVVETGRYLRMNGILVMPQRRSIDKNVRTMADYHISMKMTTDAKHHILRLATAYALFYNEWSDDTKVRILSGLGRTGRLKGHSLKLKDIPISPVQSEELIANYEKKQIKYKMMLRDLMANDIKNYEKQLTKDPDMPQIGEIAESISKDEELIAGMVVKRKVDTSLLQIGLEKNFPSYRWSSSNINTLKKILDKLIIGKRIK